MTTKFFFIALATVAVLSFGAMAMAHGNGYGYGYGHMNGNGNYGGHMMGYNQAGPGYGACPAWNAGGNAVMPHAYSGAWNGARNGAGNAVGATAMLPDYSEAR